jgi:ketosteroid isomerase-like protein
MSQANVEIVRRVYGSWPDPDLAASAGLVHPDVVIDLCETSSTPASIGASTASDVSSNRSTRCGRTFGSLPRSSSTRVTTCSWPIASRGKGRGSGIETEMRLFGVWTLREGRVSLFRGGYRNRTEALEAAGLEE